MSERVLSATYLAKTGESLIGADSEYANGRYNNCANRCYYACFQAAIAALQDAGIRSPSLAGDWSHEAAQATFAGQLSRRRKRYPTELGDALSRLFAVRQTADYTAIYVSEVQAQRALRRANRFVSVVQEILEGRQ